ncbi:MAG: Uma2 family endonuclease [Gemmataceae bacterium]|nr:Uma2 family endonuclease [Gemmataceae bacterium]
MSTVTLPERKELLAEFPANGDALYEVVNGQYVELPPMSMLASFVASDLHVLMGYHVRQNQCGKAVSETVFILDRETDLRRRPDIAFVSKDRWPLDKPIPPTGECGLVPDLVVEVISPNDLFESIFEKIDEYFAYGVRQVWVVLPRTSEVVIFTAPGQFHKLSVGQDLDGGDIIPGFRLSLADLFKQPVAAEA